jgi:hypothetical protein
MQKFRILNAEMQELWINYFDLKILHFEFLHSKFPHWIIN